MCFKMCERLEVEKKTLVFVVGGGFWGVQVEDGGICDFKKVASSPFASGPKVANLCIYSIFRKSFS